MLTTLSHYHGRPNHGPTQNISDIFFFNAVYPWLEQSKALSHATGEEVGEGCRRKLRKHNYRAPPRNPRRCCGLALLGRMFPADTNLPQPAVVTAPPRGALRTTSQNLVATEGRRPVHYPSCFPRTAPLSFALCARAAVSYIIPRYDRKCKDL